MVHTNFGGNSYGPMLESSSKVSPYTGIGPWMALPSCSFGKKDKENHHTNKTRILTSLPNPLKSLETKGNNEKIKRKSSQEMRNENKESKRNKGGKDRAGTEGGTGTARNVFKGQNKQINFSTRSSWPTPPEILLVDPQKKVDVPHFVRCTRRGSYSAKGRVSAF